MRRKILIEKFIDTSKALDNVSKDIKDVFENELYYAAQEAWDGKYDIVFNAVGNDEIDASITIYKDNGHFQYSKPTLKRGGDKRKTRIRKKYRFMTFTHLIVRRQNKFFGDDVLESNFEKGYANMYEPKKVLRKFVEVWIGYPDERRLISTDFVILNVVSNVSEHVSCGISTAIFQDMKKRRLTSGMLSHKCRHRLKFALGHKAVHRNQRNK